MNLLATLVCAGSIAGIRVFNPQNVLGPGGVPANQANPWLVPLPDEHSTIFPPHTFPRHPDAYVFFEPTDGLTVLRSLGPDANGVWTLEWASGYSPPGSVHGPIFRSPFDHHDCPVVSSIAAQDPTFDLNYAFPGGVVQDPAQPSRLFMLYEGTNKCLGSTTHRQKNNIKFDSVLGIATSDDFGETWPQYAADFRVLPHQSTTSGPGAPDGAWGSAVCSDAKTCTPRSSNAYGRYAVVGGPISMSELLATWDPVYAGVHLGDSEPSAFLDFDGFLYVVHNDATTGLPGCMNTSFPQAGRGITVSRGQLGPGRMKLMKWYAGSFELQTATSTEPGCATLTRTNEAYGGGVGSPIFAVNGNFDSCQDASQSMLGASISYYAPTREYLLTFVCRSPHDPLTGAGGPGAAWFWSTNTDLSREDLWSTPREMHGSWGVLTTKAGINGQFYQGWYPTFMSLDAPSTTLTQDGYVFYLFGSQDGGKDRFFQSRQFHVTTTLECTTPMECCVQAGGTWSGGRCM